MTCEAMVGAETLSTETPVAALSALTSPTTSSKTAVRAAGVVPPSNAKVART